MKLEEPLNFGHLHYFWAVARTGSVREAARQLHVSAPTVSAQVRQLERRLGQALLESSGRGVVLTEAGHAAFRYAEEIFTLGRELQQSFGAGFDAVGATHLRLGVTEALPKLTIYHLLQPALQLRPAIRVQCIDGPFMALINDVSLHRLDVVFSDSPVPAGTPMRLYSHLLADSAVAFFAHRKLLADPTKRLEEQLATLPLLLPTLGHSLRRSLEAWFDEHGLTPQVAHELADSSLLKVFGQAGEGIFPAPAMVREEVCAQYDVVCLGQIDTIRERFYAITTQRRLKHPAVIAIQRRHATARNL
jgi:LysR family transcriptional regulator, transcriptional activator of nhaA